MAVSLSANSASTRGSPISSMTLDDPGPGNRKCILSQGLSTGRRKRLTMFLFNRLMAIVLTAAMLGPMLPPAEARTRKGDKFLSQGRAYEAKKELDEALDAYNKAYAEDPADIVYQMAAEKCRFQTAQSHIDKGIRIRARGLLGEALLEFQRGYSINPGSAAAEQELRRT